MDHALILPVIIAVIAFLYASVGHGGASGYLMTMALAGVSVSEMRSSALLLNIVVSAIAFFQYYRAGHFSWKLLWPFALFSMPFSFIGAKISLNDHAYKIVLAVCLALAILRLLGAFGRNNSNEIRPVRLPPAFISAAIIGLISGMIGIGGGILLSPLLLVLRWADMKQSAATSAAFILLNSVSGLAGMWSAAPQFSPGIYAWLAAAVAGGTIGAYAGSRRFNTPVLKYILSAVLGFACYKLVFL